MARDGNTSRNGKEAIQAKTGLPAMDEGGLRNLRIAMAAPQFAMARGSDGKLQNSNYKLAS
jgi:hypothetical protein